MELPIEIAFAMVDVMAHHAIIVTLFEVKYIGLVPAHSKIYKKFFLAD